MGNKLSWILTGVFALGLLVVSVLLSSSNTRVKSLTEQMALLTAVAQARAEAAEAVSGKVREEHEAKLKALMDSNRALLAERDGLQHRLSSLQKRFDSLPAAECARRGKVFVEYTARGTDLSARCAEELGRKQQALEACVRSYEGIQSVYHRTE